MRKTLNTIVFTAAVTLAASAFAADNTLSGGNLTTQDGTPVMTTGGNTAVHGDGTPGAAMDHGAKAKAAMAPKAGDANHDAKAKKAKKKAVKKIDSAPQQ